MAAGHADTENVKAESATGPRYSNLILAYVFKIYPEWTIRCGVCGFIFKKRLDPFIINPTAICAYCCPINEIDREKAEEFIKMKEPLNYRYKVFYDCYINGEYSLNNEWLECMLGRNLKNDRDAIKEFNKWYEVRKDILDFVLKPVLQKIETIAEAG